jgi:hypothetical protein
MKAKIPVIVLIILMTFCIGLLSCNTDKNETNDFLIKVDSIHVPETIVSGNTFEIKFYGVIGFNGCYSFKSFNTVNNGGTIIVEAWGTSDFSNLLCPDALVTLDGYTLKLTISVPGIYKLIIHEPGNLSLETQIKVN